MAIVISHPPASSPPARPAGLAAGKRRADREPLRVLIVDDSPLVSERLAALIAGLGLGIHIATVPDGEQAMTVLRTERSHAVVLDVALPGISGFDVLEQVKAQLPACVALILTSYADQEFRAHAAALGADFFFDKTLEFDRVIDVLTQLARAAR